MSVDRLRSTSRRVIWARIDPDNAACFHPPKRQGDVGWDLEVAKAILLDPFEAKDVTTNVRIAMPGQMWAEIRARSSIVRQGLVVEAGVIDNGYRGPLFALVRNMTEAPIVVKEGIRVAQVIFHRIEPVWIQEGSVSLDTDRGEGGFGSTGD